MNSTKKEPEKGTDFVSWLAWREVVAKEWLDLFGEKQKRSTTEQPPPKRHEVTDPDTIDPMTFFRGQILDGQFA